MIVLRDASYLDMHPREILEAVRKVLAEHYGAARVCTDRRAVRVDFGVEHVDDLTGEVISFDVVPAFEDGDHYLIPDDHLGIWIPTNPKIHAELATTANENFDGQWKPLVKMIKKWNQVHGGPIEPGFLIEVMALELITGTWTGSHAYELRQFFASAADRHRRRLAGPGRRRPRHLRRPRRRPGQDGQSPDRAAGSRGDLHARDPAGPPGPDRRGPPVWRSLFGDLFPAVMTTVSRPVPAGSPARIKERQDQPEHLQRLLAYSHLYRIAQRWHRARASGTLAPGHRRAHRLPARPVHQRHPRGDQRRVAGRRPAPSCPGWKNTRPSSPSASRNCTTPGCSSCPGIPRWPAANPPPRTWPPPRHASGTTAGTATGTASTWATRPGPATSCSASG